MSSPLWPLVLRGCLVLSASLAQGCAARAEQRWAGTISDSMCGRHHESGAEGQATTDPDCTRDCVKGGSRYVLVVGDEVYAIANQDHPGLPAHAGQRVELAGTLAGDSITVTRIER